MIFSKKKRILSALLSLTMIGTMAAGVPFTASAASAADIGVSYQVYGQSYAWSQPEQADGATAGTTGKSKRVEAIIINLTGGSSLSAGASIVYQVYGQSYGWTQTAKSDGVEAGTEKRSKQIEAIRISLNNMPDYKVTYRVHQQSYGWSDWQTTDNGTGISKAAIAGVVGKSKRVEAVEIKLIKPEVKATVANVGTADDLSAALADSNIDTINFTANITASPTITRPLTINFGAYTLTGDLSFSYTGKGTSVLTGNTDNRIIGNLTVDTANASFKNGVKVSGKVNIANVEIGTWSELATGNTLYITDPDGATLDVTGHPVGVQVAASASGTLTIEVDATGTVDSLSSSAPVTVAVAAGGSVTTLTADAGAIGSTITNNGTIGTLTATVPINLVANVAPGKTVTEGSGNIVVTGSQAGSVTVTNGSAPQGSQGGSSNSGGSGNKVSISTVSVTGTAQVGTELTASLSPSAATAAYQWQESDTATGTYTNISGATASTYTPVSGDVGKYIKVAATGTGNYSGTVTSAATGAVIAAGPCVSKLVYTSPTSLLVSFDKEVDQATAETVGNYTITLNDSKITLEKASKDEYNPAEVDLTVPKMSLNDGDTIKITVSNVKNTAGSVVDSDHNSTEYTVSPKDAEIVSTVGSLNVDGDKLSFSENNHYTYDDLTKYLFVSPTATWKLYASDGTTLTETLATGDKLIVTSHDTTNVKTYTMTILSSETGFNIKDNSGIKFDGNQITVPQGTTAGKLLGAITSKDGSNEIFKVVSFIDGDHIGDTLVDSATLSSGSQLIATAEDGEMANYQIIIADHQ